jgi:hypothetical protein
MQEADNPTFRPANAVFLVHGKGSGLREAPGVWCKMKAYV